LPLFNAVHPIDYFMAKKNKSRSWLSKQLKALQKQLDIIEEKEVVEVDSTIGNAIAKKETEGTNRYPDVYEDSTMGELASFVQVDSAITFVGSTGVALKIIFYQDSTLRFRYAKDGHFESDFSYAIDPSISFSSIPYIFEEKKTKIRLQTKKLICEVAKKDMTVTIKDLKGNIICEDHKGYFHRKTLLRGTTQVLVSKKTTSDECFYGLGDK